MYFVASPASGMMNRSTAVTPSDVDADDAALSPTVILAPYLNVMNSGWCFLEVILRMVLSGRRPWIQAQPFCSGMSRRMIRYESLTHRRLMRRKKAHYAHNTLVIVVNDDHKYKEMRSNSAKTECNKKMSQMKRIRKSNNCRGAQNPRGQQSLSRSRALREFPASRALQILSNSFIFSSSTVVGPRVSRLLLAVGF